MPSCTPSQGHACSQLCCCHTALWAKCGQSFGLQENLEIWIVLYAVSWFSDAGTNKAKRAFTNTVQSHKITSTGCIRPGGPTCALCLIMWPRVQGPEPVLGPQLDAGPPLHGQLSTKTTAESEPPVAKPRYPQGRLVPVQWARKSRLVSMWFPGLTLLREHYPNCPQTVAPLSVSALEEGSAPRPLGTGISRSPYWFLGAMLENRN